MTNIVDIREILQGHFKDILAERTCKQLKPKLPLQFDSRFESGNLAIAIKRPQDYAENVPEYDLVLQNDVNTRGHTQWFFFKVKSSMSGRVRLNLVNHTKSDSLYNYGMRVLASSNKHLDYQWQRVGENISYF